MGIRLAKFKLGDVVLHDKQGYRAVVVDVDPVFQASGRFNPQALKRPFATINPWYRVLIEGSNQLSYVEECFLERSISESAIQNPALSAYLIKQEGHYRHKQLRLH